jgi:hypothetical protein
MQVGARRRDRSTYRRSALCGTTLRGLKSKLERGDEGDDDREGDEHDGGDARATGRVRGRGTRAHVSLEESTEAHVGGGERRFEERRLALAREGDVRVRARRRVADRRAPFARIVARRPLLGQIADLATAVDEAARDRRRESLPCDAHERLVRVAAASAASAEARTSAIASASSDASTIATGKSVSNADSIVAPPFASARANDAASWCRPSPPSAGPASRTSARSPTRTPCRSRATRSTSASTSFGSRSSIQRARAGIVAVPQTLETSKITRAFASAESVETTKRSPRRIAWTRRCIARGTSMRGGRVDATAPSPCDHATIVGASRPASRAVSIGPKSTTHGARDAVAAIATAATPRPTSSCTCTSSSAHASIGIEAS